MTYSPASTPPAGQQIIRAVGQTDQLSMIMTTIVAVDITGFGNRHDAAIQRHLRATMYGHLVEAFTMTRLPWVDCHREDRGDGVLIVAPPNVDADHFLDPLAHHLAVILRRGNRIANDSTRLRLRMAVHHGDVHHDARGITGAAIIHLFRLLEAASFKKAFNKAGCDLAMIVSDQLYTDATRRGGLVDADAFRRLRVTCKETRRAPAWLWLPPTPR